MLRASLRGLLDRKLRLTLAVIAIVLGVGFFSGALVLSDSLGARFKAMFASVSTNVAVQVTARTDPAQPSQKPPSMTQAELDRVAAVDGVGAVSPDVTSAFVVPYDTQTGKPLPGGGPPQLGIGIGAEGDPMGVLSLAEGRWPTGAGEVALSRHTAAQAHAAVGRQVKVFLPRLQRPQMFTVVGVAAYAGGRDSLGGETVVLLPMAQAQEAFYGRTGLYDGVSLTADAGVSDEALRDRVSAVLPATFEAKTGKQSSADQAAAVSDSISGLTKWVLTPFAGVALLVGIFLIFNTFNVLVTQRARELAMMRALGASRGQVTWSVLVEALIVGVVGGTLGLGLGALIGGGGSWVLGNLGDAKLPGSGITVGLDTVVYSYAIGILVTVVAALLPALRASRVPPLAAMREIAVTDRPLRLRAAVGVVVGLGAAALIVLGLRAQDDGLSMVAAGCGVAFLAAIVLGPLVTRPVGRAVGLLVGWGVAGSLGVRNAIRNPRRTAVTASALMIGVMLVTAASVVATSFKESVVRALDTTLRAELTAAIGFQQPDGRIGISSAAVARIRQLPEVQEVVAMHLAVAPRLNGETAASIGVGAIDNVPGAQRTMGMKRVSGEVRALNAGELVADENTAKARNWKLGDTVRIALPGAERPYRLVGTVEASPLWANFLVVPMPAVADFAGPLIPQAMIDVRDGADVAATQAKVEEILVDFPSVTVEDKSSTTRQVTQVVDIAVLIITVLLSLAMVIALLGILNTLLLSIIERTRELGMLRAIGLGRGAVVRMIGTEAVLMSAFGGLLGVGVGLGIGVALAKALVYQDAITGVWVPWWQLVAAVVVAAVAGVFAAIVPAVRAARLNVLRAIAYE
ncbi:ABC transporter [Pilimelia terevasa]|uniref:ABC transporter n=1 Tax=Pilimelia terevasa TaxID=53372 RepID=A0A8J3FK38_9ACTN|nr:FtsX-like permease family protein [Pilimelia terevasa]GGK42341.1 ABC transporter [Pilimelia terevasa]